MLPATGRIPTDSPCRNICGTQRSRECQKAGLISKSSLAKCPPPLPGGCALRQRIKRRWKHGRVCGGVAEGNTLPR